MQIPGQIRVASFPACLAAQRPGSQQGQFCSSQRGQGGSAALLAELSGAPEPPLVLTGGIRALGGKEPRHALARQARELACACAGLQAPKDDCKASLKDQPTAGSQLLSSAFTSVFAQPHLQVSS